MKTTPELLHGTVGSYEWYTPQSVINIVHTMFPDGFVDLASCAVAQERMQAMTYLDDSDGGALALPDWETGGVPAFCNPPGGKARLTQKFWARLLAEFGCGNIPEAIWLSFSIDTFQTCPGLLEDTLTFLPRQRLKYFLPATGKEVGGVRPSAITYLGPRQPVFHDAIDLAGLKGIFLCASS